MASGTGSRRLVVLGSTGSIGVQALDVLRADTDLGVQLVGLAAGSNEAAITRQAAQFGVEHVYVARRERHTSGGHGTFVESVDRLLDVCEPDIVLNAIVGFQGLAATLQALERGIDVALANKESLVAAGALCMHTAQRTGARILPVDSEHSALMQCRASSRAEEVESLVLTASGGPFRGMDTADLAHVTVEQALAHPTWTMGGKITIDSATLMNKGLELIEAQVLFDLPADRIEVLVHPHSIVHALVRHRDGSLLAHLGWPDMRVPIAWALGYPSRPAVDARRLDLAAAPPLEFHEPDLETFRCLALARHAAEAGRGAPCVLNAANEVAVEAFLAGRARFLDIQAVVERTLEALPSPGDPATLGEAQEIDVRARDIAARVLAHGTAASR